MPGSNKETTAVSSCWNGVFNDPEKQSGARVLLNEAYRQILAEGKTHDTHAIEVMEKLLLVADGWVRPEQVQLPVLDEESYVTPDGVPSWSQIAFTINAMPPEDGAIALQFLNGLAEERALARLFAGVFVRDFENGTIKLD